jgi:TonB family protein
MKPRSFQRQSFKISLALHGTAVVLMLVVPLILKSCAAKKPNEKLMFVEFTVSIPPPPAPDVPEPPKPEPPKPPEPDPDEIKEVEKKPDVKPEPPKPPKKDIRQTNRMARKDFKAPPPKDKPLSEAEIARLLKMGAHIGDTTSIPTDSQLALGAYYNHVHERMYAVWQQPSQLKSLPGLSTDVRITVAPDGRITGRTKTRGSGNDLMDDSVMKAVNTIKALRALPAGYRKPVDIEITFEIGQ